MRKIIFRGKRLDNGKWTCGHLCENLERAICIQTITEKVIDGFAAPHICYPVEPATVGQFTGLKDRNGVEIYEGDIIKWSDLTYKVVYSDSMFIGMGTGKRAGFYVLRHGAHRIVEIIGNIHDNPDLLKMI